MLTSPWLPTHTHTHFSFYLSIPFLVITSSLYVLPRLYLWRGFYFEKLQLIFIKLALNLLTVVCVAVVMEALEQTAQ